MGKVVKISVIFLMLILVKSGIVQAQSKITVEQHKVIETIVNVFENESLTFQYQYIENLNDGRGYTAGRVGFTTATGDLLEVVEQYLKMSGRSSQWNWVLPTLKDRANQGKDSVIGLELLPWLWRNSVKDIRFRRAQDFVVEKLYAKPSIEITKEYGIKSALGYLIIFDTAIQNGTGSDPDGLISIIKRVKNYHSEIEFLLQFLEIRRQVLMNPTDPKTAKEWRASVGRVKELERLIHEHNFELIKPFRINPFGKVFWIK